MFGGGGLVDEVACASMSVAVLLMRLYHALFIILYQPFDVLHEKFRPDFALFSPQRIIVRRFVAIRISAQRICKLYTQNFERIKLFVCLHWRTSIWMWRNGMLYYPMNYWCVRIILTMIILQCGDFIRTGI